MVNVLVQNAPPSKTDKFNLNKKRGGNSITEKQWSTVIFLVFYEFFYYFSFSSDNINSLFNFVQKMKTIYGASCHLKDIEKYGRNMHIFVSEREEKSEFLVSIFNSCSLAQSTMIMIYHITWLRLLPLKVASDRWRGWYYFGFCVAFPIFTWSTTNTLSASRIGTSWGGIIMGFAPLFNHYN